MENKKQIKRLEDLELLKQLYMVASPSNGEKHMRKFICRWIRKNVPDALIECDKVGNIFVRRGESDTYPCQVSHIDEVHDRKNGLILMLGNDLIGGRNRNDYQPEGIGADDKNGIYVCLMLLRKHPVMKCAFFVGEEIGCVGSSACKMDFFDDVRFVLQCDRKGSSDFVTEIGYTELSTEEWQKAIGLDKFGYKTHDGGMTDVMQLKERGLNVCCANMSCGYYNPHTDKEVTVLSELQNTYELCDHIVSTMTDVYPHEYDGSSAYYRRGRYGYYGGYYDDYYLGYGSCASQVGSVSFNSTTPSIKQSTPKDDEENECIKNQMRQAELYDLFEWLQDEIMSYINYEDFDLAAFYLDTNQDLPHTTPQDYIDYYEVITGSPYRPKNVTDAEAITA